MRQNYDPNNMLDHVSIKLNLKNDAALARALEVTAPLISKVRHMRLTVGASLLIRIHDITGMPVRELQDIMGDRRRKFRLSSAQGRPRDGVGSAPPE
jgi:transcriptional regulator with XRE-family HTH domain